MANKFAGNPWIVDTPGAAVLIPYHIKVRHFEFVDYALDTDVVQVKDATGAVVWRGNGASDLRPIPSGNIGAINGLIVDVLAAGAKLLIYIE